MDPLSSAAWFVGGRLACRHHRGRRPISGWSHPSPDL